MTAEDTLRNEISALAREVSGLAERVAGINARIDSLSDLFRDDRQAFQASLQSMQAELRVLGIKMVELVNQFETVRQKLADMGPSVKKVNGLEDDVKEMKPSIRQLEDSQQRVAGVWMTGEIAIRAAMMIAGAGGGALLVKMWH